VIRSALGIVGGLLVIAVFGAGVPLLWVWVGSQLQGGTAPSMSGLGVTLLGITGSYALLAVMMAWVKARLAGEGERPVRHAWNRSLSAERYQGPRTHPVEDVVVSVTILVGIVCTAWFLLAGDPGVPVGY